MKKWKKIGPVRKIRRGEGESVRVRSRRIAVFNVDGEFYATDDACPHRGAPLGDGPLTGTVVTCTWHGWEFDVKSGRCVFNPDISMNRYETKVEKGHVYVRLDEPL